MATTCSTPTPGMRAAWTGSGRCGSGWTGRRWAAMKGTCHGSIGTTSTRRPRADRRDEPTTSTLDGQTKESVMNTPPTVTQDEWEAARQQLLVKEKQLTRARDALAAERRRMPWLAVEKEYEFDGPKGKASLLDLFDGRRQLIVYRAFFEPGVKGWPEHACIGCSMVADQ